MQMYNPQEQQSALEQFGRDFTELARKGKLDPVIGGDDEIRRIIQVLSRRTKNNPVLIGEPTVEDTIAILRGIKERYEIHHGVRIKDSALIAAATLSHRYISGRFLPDKAVDLVDEASARLRIEIDSMPTELDEVERRIMQLEIERQALSKEKDKGSKERLYKLNEELNELKEKSSEMKKQWKKEKDIIQEIRKIKEDIETAKTDESIYEREGNLEKVAKIRYGIIGDLKKKIEEENKKLIEVQKHHKMLKEEVDEEDIAEVVSKWTGIPMARLLEGEKEKLVKMEVELQKRVVGQDDAIAAVSNSVRRTRAGLQNPLALKLLEGGFGRVAGDAIKVTLQDKKNEIIFK